jgi:hypothetical protein
MYSLESRVFFLEVQKVWSFVLDMKTSRLGNPSKILWRTQIFIAAVLFVLALAKQHSISMPQALPSIDSPDYVIGFITKRQSLAFGAFIEVFVAVILIFFRNSLIAYSVLGSFSSALAGYRFIMWNNAGLAPCNCMGTLANWFSISVRVEGWIMFLLICVMFFVSVLGFVFCSGCIYKKQ